MALIQRCAGNSCLQAFGQRIVHGGELFSVPVILTYEDFQQCEALIPLAPLQQPTCLAAVCARAESHPDILQIGCFDTAFHKHHAPVFRHYALPKYLRDQGIC
ncbi:hypothetical protein [Bythopirellula goksoeyrii]|uniref:hypothetical protein n=1 Tax=Bythopirellula goksoeyrii TaxID=1400387 RepID=UPI00143DA1D7